MTIILMDKQKIKNDIGEPSVNDNISLPFEVHKSEWPQEDLTAGGHAMLLATPSRTRVLLQATKIITTEDLKDRLDEIYDSVRINKDLWKSLGYKYL